MKQRIITAIVAACIFIPIIFIGGAIFDIVMVLLGIVGLYEFFQMKKLQIPSSYGIASFLVVILLIAPYDFYNGLSIPFNKEIIFIIFALFLLACTVTTKNIFEFDSAGALLMMMLYITLGFSCMALVRDLGMSVFLFPLFTVWATDSGAYFIGKRFGKRKLWPQISPNKTVGGFMGGILFGLAVGFIFYGLGYISFSIALLSIFISITAQFGDLVQSAFKRHYGVKDSGNILPGHGGILDRFDSLIYVMPIYYYFLSYLLNVA